MRIQCSACEAAEAKVLCCADEAALCWACDEKVHAANKLAGKHQRVPLLSSSGGGAASPMVPKCDICQEASGYFFCLEDRALLCRNCDVSIHTANSHVSLHRRFLVTGVQVGLDPAEPVASIADEQLNAAVMTEASPSKSLPKRSSSMSSSAKTNVQFSSQLGTDGALRNKVPFPSITMTGNMRDWPLDEFFGFSEYNHNIGFTEHGSSMAESGKLGSLGDSPHYGSADEDFDTDEYLGQVPEIPWTVPEIPSPPTASGLHWQKNLHYPASESTAFVPDICSYQSPNRYMASAFGPKRLRRW